MSINAASEEDPDPEVAYTVVVDEQSEATIIVIIKGIPRFIIIILLPIELISLSLCLSKTPTLNLFCTFESGENEEKLELNRNGTSDSLQLLIERNRGDFVVAVEKVVVFGVEIMREGDEDMVLVRVEKEEDNTCFMKKIRGSVA